MEIIVLGHKIDTKDISDIYDVERDKQMFLNRESGFIIQFMDGSKKVFKENIPYESYSSEIREIKQRWLKLQNEVDEKWKADKHELPEFGF